jgi:hypothetical protein
MIDTRDTVFDRLTVDFLVTGGTRVSWRYGIHFVDPGPYSSQLQVGDAGTSSADDWVNVGAAVANVGTLVDPARRGFGRNPTTYYRVVVTTPLAAYTSKPAHIDGTLSRRDWLNARDIVRQERLILAKGTGIAGWLFRRRRAGVTPSLANPRTAITDPMTGGIVRPQAPSTIGTEYNYGFFLPVPFRVDTSPAARREQIDPTETRGTIEDPGLSIQGRVVIIPQINEQDVFVAASSDQRYYFHGFKTIARLRGTPLVAECELRLAPYSDVIYLLEIPT